MPRTYSRAETLSASARDHVSVCICTYKRSKSLTRLLSELQNQVSDGLFTYSVVVVDNDHMQSAKSVVESFKERSFIDINYYNEPIQNIALARNKAIEHATGDFVGFIDDDECPSDTWLYKLYTTLEKYGVDGVLGPVKPHFEIEPPEWITKGKLCERPSFKTGSLLSCKYSRTGNVLFTKKIIDNMDNLFNPDFGQTGGEDVDFFRRMAKKGHTFVWCDEAPVYETVPPERLKRSYFLRRALLRGSVSFRITSQYSNVNQIPMSVLAFSIYTLALPVFFFLGHHIFMKYLIKDCDHLGKLLAACGINVIKERFG